MSDDLIFWWTAAIGIILFWWFIGIFLVKWGRKFNPYKHTELKKIWKLIQAKIIEIDNENYQADPAEYYWPRVTEYFILEYIDSKKKRYAYKIYSDFLKSKNLGLSNAFSKKIVRKFKVGDSIKCYINIKNPQEFYIDPEDIFTDKITR